MMMPERSEGSRKQNSMLLFAGSPIFYLKFTLGL